ncbi:MAG TPA: mechanosensitive ion channel [Candidatus Scybalocola faecavium]|nr:mechanosensitive ion channel [Candidatus Scybalocola faecavium]
MNFWIMCSSQLETGLEQLNQAGEVIQETGVSASTISVWLEQLGNLAVAAALTLLRAVIVAVIGWYLIKFLCRWIHKLLVKSNLDDGISGFLSSVIKAILTCLLVVIVIGILGIPMSSVVALVGSAGLAIGLALQGCLTNFSGGVLILIVKPFKVGDYIIDGSGNEGTVTAIDIIYTKLLTSDNRSVTIPNGTLANSTIINTTRELFRRVDFNVSISYDEDIDRVKSVLLETAHTSGFALEDKDCIAFVASFDPSAVKITLRFWVKSEDYWNTKWTMQELIKKRFDENKISIPYDQLDIHVVDKSA